jgi:hypothetical protein
MSGQRLREDKEDWDGEKPMITSYPAAFINVGDGSCLVYFPDLDLHVMDDLDEAMETAVDALAYRAYIDKAGMAKPSQLKSLNLQSILQKVNRSGAEAALKVVSVDAEDYAKENFSDEP